MISLPRFVVGQVDSNLVIIWVDPALCSPGKVVAALAVGEVTQVRAIQWTKTELRLAFHCSISHTLAAAANKKVEEVICHLLEEFQ